MESSNHTSSYLLELSALTFVGVLIAIALLVTVIRKLHRSRDNAPILKAIEAMREQSSVEHGWLQGSARHGARLLGEMRERLGFLKPKVPPANDIKGRPFAPPEDDTQ